MSVPLFSAPQPLDFEVPLVAPLPVAPAGGGRHVVLCRGAVVRVARISRDALVYGIEFGGRRYSVPVADFARCVAPAPAPEEAPCVPGVPVVRVGWEPRHRVRPGASAGPAFRSSAPRRAGAPSSESVQASRRNSPLWEWRS